MKEKKRIGRPPEAVPKAKIESLVAHVSEGKTVRGWCRANNVGFTTVYDWLKKDKIFAERLARARIDGEDALSQECLEIADDASNDWMESHGPEGDAVGWKLNAEHVQRSKLRIETRLKLLAVWNPGKWGAKQHVEHSGKLGLESLIAGGE